MWCASKATGQHARAAAADLFSATLHEASTPPQQRECDGPALRALRRAGGGRLLLCTVHTANIDCAAKTMARITSGSVPAGLLANAIGRQLPQHAVRLHIYDLGQVRGKSIAADS